MATTGVPGARAILGFDPSDPAFRADPYAAYRRIAEAGTLTRTEAGLWVTASYGLCESVLRDHRFGHRPEGGGWRRASRPSFLTMDPPDHTRLRRLVGRAFTPRLVERLRPRVEEVVDGLLADAAGGPFDLVTGLAHPLPVIIISELLGVPARDRDRFRGWSDALARGLDPDFLLPPDDLARRDEARAEFGAYFRELAALRRDDPRDDLLTALTASYDGDALTEAELLATCVLLLVAGHETTVNLIGNGALALLRNPDQLAWFRAHPDAASVAVEELLRYDPPVQFTVRAALEDVELAGTPIRTGEIVLLLTGAANRDPAAFPDRPDDLDVTRYANAETARHLAFGLGIHYCLGAPLARLEGGVALRELFARDVVPAEGPGGLDEPSYRDNIVLRGLAGLPLLVAPA
ncbi:cytochrome P450 [Actinomadura harenae]|uniref:Cytochrome P450 n=1 Tax=Actinomadura harenae TaxID=2483351 RepID=A0A3M2M755_9ACTN|nr:cytochrome P450 [Actinomadura harenae]RMI45362.1 cytochrome P450 [Actinomadura harenae]